jgi:hypothetical protein
VLGIHVDRRHVRGRIEQSRQAAAPAADLEHAARRDVGRHAVDRAHLLAVEEALGERVRERVAGQERRQRGAAPRLGRRRGEPDPGQAAHVGGRARGERLVGPQRGDAERPAGARAELARGSARKRSGLAEQRRRERAGGPRPGVGDELALELGPDAVIAPPREGAVVKGDRLGGVAHAPARAVQTLP